MTGCARPSPRPHATDRSRGGLSSLSIHPSINTIYGLHRNKRFAIPCIKCRVDMQSRLSIIDIGYSPCLRELRVISCRVASADASKARAMDGWSEPGPGYGLGKASIDGYAQKPPQKKTPCHIKKNRIIFLKLLCLVDDSLNSDYELRQGSWIT